MKKLIFILSLVYCVGALAQNKQEPQWKESLRSLITSIGGEAWGNRLLGAAPDAAPEITLPEIPKALQKSTDTATYAKVNKEPTEFEKLPSDKKKQYDYQFIEELFLVTRKAEARDEDLSNWLNTLEQGGSREGIYQALVLDEVYSELEGIAEKPSTKLVEFCLQFSEKYLNQTFKPEALSELNLYSLKRIFTEKGLDLLEYYEVKDLDALYRWYAVVSANLARNHRDFLKSEVRSDTSEKYHYEWARSMPLQHIKSEFIIKLHKIMNGLQLLNQ